MSRRFSNFFEAYQTYFEDSFVPPQFNEWACLSIIAAALERKVWLPWNDAWSCYPNLYVLLTSGPGEGKTQALNNAVGLLEDANKRTGGTVSILPNQCTEAAFIRQLGYGRNFQHGTRIIMQSAAYYRAAEASASLRNIYGEFLACLTDLYDCPERWSRATIKDGNPIELKNVCVNLLAASTFDYLSELVNDKNIMGGFASRLLYILSRDKPVAAQSFQSGIDAARAAERKVYREALVEDLCAIHRMIGPMTAEPAFAKSWEAWYLDNQVKRKAIESEKLRSLLVRQNLHMLKVSTLLSAAESDDRILKLRHWEKALALVQPAMDNIPDVFRESRMNQLDRGQTKNIPHAVIQTLKRNPHFTPTALRSRLIFNGADPRSLDNVLSHMIQIGIIGIDSGKFVILSDPDNHL